MPDEAKPKAKQYNSKYNWEKWFAKRRMKLVKGRDFHIGVASMVQQVRCAASKRGISVSVVETDDGVLMEKK